MKRLILAGFVLILFCSIQIYGQDNSGDKSKIHFGISTQYDFYHIEVNEMSYNMRKVGIHPSDRNKYPDYNDWGIAKLKYNLWNDCFLQLFVEYQPFKNFGAKLTMLYNLNSSEDIGIRNYTTENMGTQIIGANQAATFCKIYKVSLLGYIFKGWRTLDIKPELYFTQSYPLGFRAYASISYGAILVANGWYRNGSAEEYKEHAILADCIPISMKMFLSVYKTKQVNVEANVGMVFLNIIRKDLGVKSGLSNNDGYYSFGITASLN